MITTFSPDARVVDLHAHTTASDGDHTPSELVLHAKRVGLEVLAVTDHDTTRGVAEAVQKGNELGMQIVSGIELSAEPKSGQCHILGLGVDANNPVLNSRLEEVLYNRNTRNQRIIHRIQSELDWDITLEEVEAVAGGEVVARPHFARIMVEKGYVPDVKTAFDVYLGKGGKVYVDRDRLTPEESIGLIHGAGGVAILAHPNNLKLAPEATEEHILELKEMGLDGIEARYNQHTAEDTARYLAMASKHQLLTSGGSDFHGASVKPTVFLGYVEGNQPAPYSIFSELQERIQVMRA